MISTTYSRAGEMAQWVEGLPRQPLAWVWIPRICVEATGAKGAPTFKVVGFDHHTCHGISAHTCEHVHAHRDKYIYLIEQFLEFSL